MRSILLFSFFAFSFPLFGQISLDGIVIDATTQEPLIGASVEANEGGTVTDFSGNFSLDFTGKELQLVISYIGYQELDTTFTVLLSENKAPLRFALNPSTNILETATVTSGRFEKALGEVTVSMEVIKPTLINSINSTSIDEVLEKVPGVTMIDGQPNIRGGSGFSYGAGSRVLVLVDDIPILQADAGLANWDDLPLENVEQIEVVKGAGSALYGSSALNGVINLRTGYAKNEPVTKAFYFGQIFSGPGDTLSAWWRTDTSAFVGGFGGGVLHKQKFGKLDVVLGGYQLYRNNPNRDTYQRYYRGNGSLRYRINDRFAVGVKVNYNTGNSGNYFYWKGTGNDLFEGTENSITTSERTRYNIDPFVTYFDKRGNRHKLLGRYFGIDNENNANQANQSDLYYSEYQYQRTWQPIQLNITGGLVYTQMDVQAELYGDTIHQSRNYAGYLQLDKKFGDRFNLSGGFRIERNEQSSPAIVGLDTIAGGRIEETKPVFRLGANYQLAEGTFLRASWGQGYRYPTVAERFTETLAGGIRVLPNPNVQSETGWTLEIGVKQGMRLGEWSGFIDLSGFWSEYQNMMEFSFNGAGFRSVNVGATRIRGAEISVAGQGNIGKVKTSVLAGYTYIDPRYLDFDTTPIFNENPTVGQINAQNSSIPDNILKYRSQHLVKFDMEGQFKGWSLGGAANYNSHQAAIDNIFQLFIPGIAQFREQYNSGWLLLNLRAGYSWQEGRKISILGDNLTNRIYAPRPGQLAPLRSFTLRLDYQF